MQHIYYQSLTRDYGPDAIMAHGLQMDHMMILSLVTIQPLSGKEKEALDILKSIQELLRLKSSCISSSIFQSCDNSNSILYLECWKSRDVFQRHIQSDLYRRILAVMELSESPPDVQFVECAQSEGLDLVASLRQGNVAAAGG